ncbi:MAG: glycosyltransferase family 2 protein [Dehalococcoidia bacterium]|nr:glycosyltransferase family 2 protein [Dehalococcoidia bacterium]
MNVAVIVVSWNVRELLAQCLASVQAEAATWRNGRVETWVVDNASTDGSAAMVRERFPGVHVIESGRNAGYGAGCNRALAALPADMYAILLLNPDATLQPHSLAALADTLTAHPEAAVVGPQVLGDDGALQSTRRRFPRLRTAFLESTILHTYWSGNPELRRYYCWDQPEGQDQAVDWLMGAAWLVRASALREIGGFDEQFFMYFEETDWAWRAARAGWAFRYQPAAKVTHGGGRSSDQVPKLRHVYFVQSKVRFYRKHFGDFRGELVRRFLMLNYALQIAEDAVKLALRHKPTMRRERMGLYGAVLREAFGC